MNRSKPACVILAGDIGGTNARLASVKADGTIERQARFDSKTFSSLTAVVQAFLGGTSGQTIEAATFGIAGPVVGQKVTATNFPWVIDGAEVSKELGTRITLQNDLVSLAWGALHAAPDQLRLLQGGAPPVKTGQTIAVIAAGTGLGEAALVWDEEDSEYIPLPTEGGHASFAPSSALEEELAEWLRKRFGGHVSYERVVAGPGIGNVYDFLRDAKGRGETADAEAKIAAAKDRNKCIADLGAARTSETARDAVHLFLRTYGAEAGNLALKTLATGGVFVAGGIAASMADQLADGPFLPAFRDKGRMSGLLSKIPVAIVMDSDIGLKGSAAHAARTAKHRAK